ncbi:MAG: sodium-dependent transporter [Gemmatimonadales bacterium]
MASEQKEQWGTRLGVILAVAGSAVGLGNFLRFPGQAAQNGGGAFLIPYFCALVFLGIPIGWAEWTMGRYAGKKGFHSAPGIMGVVGGGSLWRYLGVVGAVIPLAVSFYYVFIESWTVAYFLKYVTGGLGIDVAAPIADQTATSAAFYNNIIGAGQDGSLFTGDSRFTLICWVAVFLVNIFFVFRGLSKGIEKFCSFAMPIMAVCALIVLIRVLTLGTPDPSLPEQSVLHGLGYMWNPDFSALSNSNTWLAAAGQIFFSISVGFGIIMNYASYMKRKADVALASITSTATNELFEVGFGGMITLTASVVFLGLSGTIAAVQTGSFGLGFTTLPVVFAHMGPIGNLVGAVWFFMLFLAAITSSLSMYQPAVATIKETLGVSHGKATLGTVLVGSVGAAMVLWYTAGGIGWNTVDFWIGTFLIYVMAMIQIICFAWVFGIDRGYDELHYGAAIRLPPVIKVVMKYVAPIYLLVIFGMWLKQNFISSVQAAMATPGARNPLLFVGLVIVGMIVLVRMGESRWRAAGLDLDGKIPADGDQGGND